MKSAIPHPPSPNRNRPCATTRRPHRILLIGSGPIVIGQACEFDYSGTQACKALREEGYEVILVNSNPATIMTDPATADRTYIEPLTWEMVAKVIEAERPDALLPTLGGQTGLNVAMDLDQHGVLEKYGVEMIGANADVIDKAESRERFQAAMDKIGLEVCRGKTVRTIDEARDVARRHRPARRRAAQFHAWAAAARASPTTGTNSTNWSAAASINRRPPQVLIEESIIGWKEYEMEVMRDGADNVVIICSIENFDPMGIHTGDSITVAPAQTLSDKEYQRMRDASLAVIREIGVETGGSNIQFAIHPETGRMIVIEMNPRVSRSSALARKATGFPIAKIAAKLAVGYRLHELPNDITRETTACFEPTIDYVVTKIPRFAFEKFPEADATLTTQMKSVGETMAIGSTFKEIVPKGTAGAGSGQFWFRLRRLDLWGTRTARREKRSKRNWRARAERVWYLRYALKGGMTIEDRRTHRHRSLVSRQPARNRRERRAAPRDRRLGRSLRPELRTAKRFGFSDRQLATIFGTEMEVRKTASGVGFGRSSNRSIPVRRNSKPTRPTTTRRMKGGRDSGKGDRGQRNGTGLRNRRPDAPVLHRPIPAANHDSRRRTQSDRPGDRVRLLLLPRQFAMRELGIESVMVNSNPETVSTDYDTSDLLFFEPLTVEDVLNICDRVKPDGVIVQFGGQTPLNLARALKKPACRLSARVSRRSKRPRIARNSSSS